MAGQVITRGSNTGVNPGPPPQTQLPGSGGGLSALIQALQANASRNQQVQSEAETRQLQRDEGKAERAARAAEGAASRASQEGMNTADNVAAGERNKAQIEGQLEATRMNQPDAQAQRMAQLWNDPITKGMFESAAQAKAAVARDILAQDNAFNFSETQKYAQLQEKINANKNFIASTSASLQMAANYAIAQAENNDISSLLKMVNENVDRLDKLDQGVRTARNMSTGLGRSAASNYSELVNKGGAAPTPEQAATKEDTKRFSQAAMFSSGNMPPVFQDTSPKLEPTTQTLVPGSIPSNRWKTIGQQFAQGALAGLDTKTQELYSGLVFISATGKLPVENPDSNPATPEAVQAWLRDKAATPNALASIEGHLAGFISHLEKIQSQQGASITENVKNADPTGKEVAKLNLRGVKIPDEIYAALNGSLQRTLMSIATEVSPESIELEAARRVQSALEYGWQQSAGDTKAAAKMAVAATYIGQMTEMKRLATLDPTIFDPQKYQAIMQDFEAATPETAAYVNKVINDDNLLREAGGYEGMTRTAINQINAANPRMAEALKIQQSVGRDTKELVTIAKGLAGTPGVSPDEQLAQFEKFAATASTAAENVAPGVAASTRGLASRVAQRGDEAKSLIKDANASEARLNAGLEPNTIGAQYGSFIEGLMAKSRELDMRTAANGAALSNLNANAFQWAPARLYSGQSPAAQAMAQSQQGMQTTTPAQPQPMGQPQPAQPMQPMQPQPMDMTSNPLGGF